MTLTQLQKISDYINITYNLNTGVYENSIYVSVWNQSLTDTYDIEMSKEQIEDFNKEFLNNNLNK
jgi:uncharacterized protein YfkK (UPF0435 family)